MPEITKQKQGETFLRVHKQTQKNASFTFFNAKFSRWLFGFSF